jgi:hypothetical protein
MHLPSAVVIGLDSNRAQRGSVEFDGNSHIWRPTQVDFVSDASGQVFCGACTLMRVHPFPLSFDRKD